MKIYIDAGDRLLLDRLHADWIGSLRKDQLGHSESGYVQEPPIGSRLGIRIPDDFAAFLERRGLPFSRTPPMA
jgi:hypothetical protein